MWRNERSNRPVFLTICLSILVLAVVASLLVWYSLTQPPIPPLATCGTVDFPLTRPVSNNTQQTFQQVEHCFSRAYQQCAAISMEVSKHYIDTGKRTLYWPHQQEKTCQIIAQSSSFSMVFGVSFPKTETCQSVLPKNGGLLFQRCSTSGDVFIAG